MAYNYRITVDDEYLLKLGRAFYNYTYLEGIVIQTIAKLSADGFASVPTGKPGGEIAQALDKAIKTSEPTLPAALRQDLARLHTSFLEAIQRRNKLLHARPYIAEGGQQRLTGGGYKWPPEEVDEAARLFEEIAITGNAIYYEQLKIVRPD